MSSVDERIVQMTFENHLFEKNVATSIDTLNKLKDAMKFDEATTSLGNIEKTVGAVNFSRLEQSIDSIQQRFSTFGIVGMTVIQDLTRSAERLGLSLYNATIGQIKAGGWTRATNIDKAQFAVEGLKMSWEDLKPIIDDVVTDTRFGFDEAAMAASQLAASNVQIGDDMHEALRSIANVASQTGAEFSDIAHIYTTTAANGRLMGDQLMSLSVKGFNAAAAMAKVWNKSESEVRDMLGKGEISFKMFSDAMNEYLGEGAQRANQTFEGSLANMKAALSRIGQPFAKSIRDHAIPVFNQLKDVIKDVKSRIQPLEEIFEKFATGVSNVFVGILGKLDLSWIDWIVGGIQKAYDMFDGFMSKISPFWNQVTDVADKVTETTEKVVQTAIDIDDMANRVIRGEFGNGLERQEALAENYEIIQNKVNEILGCSYRYDVAEQQVTESVEENTDAVSKNAEAVGKSNELWNEQASLITNAKNIISTWPQRIKEAFSSVIDKDAAINKLATMLAGVRSAFEIVGKTVFAVADGAIGPMSSTLAHLVNIFLNVGSAIGAFLTAVNKILTAIGAFKVLKIAVTGVANALSFVAKIADGAIGAVTSILTGSFNLLGNSFENTRKAISHLWESIKRSETLHNLYVRFVSFKGALIKLKKNGIDAVKDAFNGMMQTFKNVKKSVTDLWKAFTHSYKFIQFKAHIIAFKNDLIELKDKALSKVTGAVDALKDGFKDAGLSIKTKLQKSIANLLMYFDPLVSKIKSGVGYIGDFIKKVKETAIVKNTVKNLSTVFTDLYDTIKNTAPFKVLSNGFKSAGTMFQTAKSRAVEFIKETAEKLKNGTFEFPEISFKGAKKAINDGIEWIKEKFKKFKMPEFSIEGIKESVKNGTSWIKEKFENFKFPEFSLEGIKTSFNDMVTWIKEHVINKIVEKFKSFKIPEFNLDKVYESFNDCLDWIKEKIKNFKIPEIDLSKFKESIDDAIEWIKEKIKNFKLPEIKFDGVKQVFENIINWFIDKLNKTFKNLKLPAFKFDNVKKSFTKNLNWIKTKLSTFNFPSLGLDKLGALSDSLSAKLKDLGINIPLPSFDNFGTMVSNATKSVRSFGKEVISKVKLPKLFKDVGLSTKVLTSGFSKFGETMKQTGSKGLEAIGDGLSFVHKHAENGSRSIREFFDGFHETPVFRNSIHGLSDAFKSLFDNLRESTVFKAVTDWFAGFGKIFEKYDGNFFALVMDVIEHVKKPILDALQWILSKILAFLNWIKDPIIAVVTNVVKGVVFVIQKVLGFLTNDKDVVKHNIFDTIIELIKKLRVVLINFYSFKALRGLFLFISGLGNTANSIGKIAKNSAKVVKAFKNTLEDVADGIKRVSKAKARDLNATALLKTAAAIAVLALAFKLLSTISWDQFEVGAAAILTITAALAILMKVANAQGRRWNPLMSVGQGLNNLGKSIKKGLKNIGRAALIFSFIFAVKSILDAIKELTDFNWSDAKNGIKIMGAIMAEIVLSMALINITGIGGNFGKDMGMAAMILSFTIAVKAIANAMAKLSKIDSRALANGKHALQEIMILFGLIVAVYAHLGTSKKKKKPKDIGKGRIALILAMTLAIWVIANQIEKLSKIKTKNLNKARNALMLVGLTVAGMAIAIGNLSKSVASSGKKASLVGIGGLVIALGAIVLALAALTKLDTTALETAGSSLSKVILAISGLTAVMALMAKFDINAASMLSSASGVGIVVAITAIAGFVASLLGLIPNIEDFMRGGSSVLEEFAGWIGSFIGGLVGGALKGIGDFIGGDIGASFDALPEKLSKFIENFEPFLDAIADLSADGANAFLDVMRALGKVFVLDVFDSIFEKLTGTSSFTEFGTRLSDFADAIVSYSDKVKGKIDEKAVESSAKAGQMLVDLEASIPNSGGKIAKWFGDNTFTGFGSRLNSFANAITNYSNIVSENPINEEAVASSARAGQLLADLENAIPNGGGKIAELLGDNTLTKFSEGLEPFAKAITAYSAEVAGKINESAVESSARAGKILADLEGSIQNIGGISGLIFGDNRIDDFGIRLRNFGTYLVDYSNIVDGAIKYGSVTATQNVAKIFIALENSIGDAGGIINSLFFGSNDIESFGNRLVAFATSLVTFTGILAGDNNLSGTEVPVAFNPEAIAGMIESIQGLVDFANTLTGTNYGEIAESLNGINTLEVVIMDHFQKLSDAVNESSDTDFEAPFNELGKKLAQGLADGIQNGLTSEDEASNMQAVAKAIAEGLGDEAVLSEVSDNAKNLGKEILKSLSGIMGENGDLAEFTDIIKTTFSDVLTDVINSVEEKTTSLTETGSRWATAIANGLKNSNATNAVASAARNLGNSALNALKNLTSSFTSVGTSFGSNVATGITSSGTTVRTAARTLGTTAGTSFTSGYKTTATVFVPGQGPQGDIPALNNAGQAMGGKVAEGIQEGLDKSVTDFAENVATMVSYANAAMNEELDTNPVITPVLDLTNIQNGNGLLNNYLGTGTIGVNAKGINSYTSSLLSGAGGTNSANLQAKLNNMNTINTLNGIRSDIKDLGSAMGNMQMVLNNGVLVGQIGNSMDRQLGTIQKFKERWA